MVWFVTLEPLDRGDEIDENSPGVAAKVLFCPEILDKVFRCMGTESVLSARSVCKKWSAISSISLKRRLESGMPETRSIFYLKSLNKPEDYCSRWLKLDFKDEEPRTSEEHRIFPVYRKYFDEEEESIGVSIEGQSGTLHQQDRRALAILELVPSFDWRLLITVVQVQDSLAVQDWMKVEGALVGTLKSLKCMHLDLSWRSWTPEDSEFLVSRSTLPQRHDVMREIYFTYPWESWSPEDGAAAAEFEQRFLRMCPNLQVLCSNRQSFVKVKTCLHQNCLGCARLTKTIAKYDAMFKREGPRTTWDITFQYEVFDQLKPPTTETVRRELQSMFDQVPIGILRHNARENVDCVSTIVSSSCSASLRRLDLNTVLMPRGAYGYVAQQLRNWSNNQAFSKVRTLVLTFGAIERTITEVDYVPVEHNQGFGFASSLNNVNRVEVGSFCMDYSGWSQETLNTCQSKDVEVARYWAGVLQFTPHVELLAFSGRARSLWSMAKRLPKLKHIVFQCFNPQDTLVVNQNEVFEAEMDSLIWGLQELQSFTLDFEPKDQKSSRFWDRLQVSKRARALLDACNVREDAILVQINSPALQRVDVDLMLSTNCKTIVRGFHEKHGDLYQIVKDTSLDAFSWNAGGLVFLLSSKVNPVYEVERIPC